MLRALLSIGLGLVLIASSGCGSGNDSAPPPPPVDTPPDESALCAWLTPSLSSGGCGANSWRDIAAWRTDEQRLDVSYLYFSGSSDPVEDARLQTEQGFQAAGRPDLPRWPLTLPLAWGADPYKDTNWRFQLHAWRMLDPLILAWLETNDRRYIEQALAIVNDWYAFHVTSASTSWYSWNDMSTGVRAMKIAFLLDRAFRGEFALDEQSHAILVQLAELHARKLHDKKFLTQNNHGVFQLHGLVALCKTLPYLKSCPGALDFAEEEMKGLMALQFSAEGIHLEHSPSYHFFGIDLVQRMLLRSGWYEDFEDLKALTQLATDNESWLVTPDKKIIEVGDSFGPVTVDFPAGDPTCTGAGAYESRCYLTKAFPVSGYGMVRSDWAIPEESASMLFFMAGFHSTSHKHADDLSFELFEFGEPFLTDSGKYSFSVDQWRDFVVSTRAHNALEINGSSNSLRPEDAYGSALRNVVPHGDAFLVDGELRHSGSGATQRRRIYYKPQAWLLVIDQLSGGNVTMATQWFHFAPQVQVTGPTQSLDGAPMFLARLASGREVNVEQILPACPGALAKGSTNPNQGWYTRDYGDLEPRYSVGFTCPTPVPAQATLFVLDPANRSQAAAEVDAVLRELGLRP